MSLLSRGYRQLRSRGLKYVLRMAPRAIHKEFIRPHLPLIIVNYNSVKVAVHRWLDSLIPWETPPTDRPEYETALCRELRTRLNPGETVLIVGGGWGVSTVVAARQVGPSGHVISYEAGADYIPKIRDTIIRNGVEGRVTIEPAVVGELRDVRGQRIVNNRIQPSEFPQVDAIVLDCEGAESAILPQIEQRPRLLVVETHGLFDSPTATVRRQLNDLGYDIISHSIAEEHPDHRAYCIENDVYVLTAVRN